MTPLPSGTPATATVPDTTPPATTAAATSKELLRARMTAPLDFRIRAWLDSPRTGTPGSRPCDSAPYVGGGRSAAGVGFLSHRQHVIAAQAPDELRMVAFDVRADD